MTNEGGFCFNFFPLSLSPTSFLKSGKAEQEIVTYVLTIMNAVQLLFKQSSLGREVLISVVLMDVLKLQPVVSLRMLSVATACGISFVLLW